MIDMPWIQVLLSQARKLRGKSFTARSQRDKYPLAALSISPELGMTDDLARLPGTNILCFLRAISVARYLSRVCIIVVYYLPLGTFNLHHFLPRRTMPEQRRDP
jgi:hypothetical protein